MAYEIISNTKHFLEEITNLSIEVLDRYHTGVI